MSALDRIPGLAGYIAAQEQARQREGSELQQASGAMGLMAALAKQQQEQQFRGEIEALGPNPTQESLAQLAARHSGPEAVMRAQEASLGRKATAEARAFEFSMTMDQRQQDLDRRLAADLRRTEDTAARRAFEERYKVDQQNLQRQRDLWNRHFAEQGIDIKKLIVANREPAAPVAVIGPDGKPVLVPRSEAIGKTPAGTEKPLTEFQGRNVLFGTRAAQSDKILKTLEDKISLTGMAAAGKLGAAGNFVMSSEQRRVKQAQRDFVNAVLRQESGAVISDAEFDNATKQYFPAPGDDKKTIEQKRANRALAIKGFARLAGPGGSDVQAIIDAPLIPGAPADANVPPPPPGFELNQ